MELAIFDCNEELQIIKNLPCSKLWRVNFVEIPLKKYIISTGIIITVPKGEISYFFMEFFMPVSPLICLYHLYSFVDKKAFCKLQQKKSFLEAN